MEYKSPTDLDFNQIVITEEIDGELFQWLSALTDKLTEDKARNLVTTAYGLTENEDKRLAEAIVQVLTSANEKVFEKMRMILWHQHCLS